MSEEEPREVNIVFNPLAKAQFEKALDDESRADSDALIARIQRIKEDPDDQREGVYGHSEILTIEEKAKFELLKGAFLRGAGYHTFMGFTNLVFEDYTLLLMGSKLEGVDLTIQPEDILSGISLAPFLRGRSFSGTEQAEEGIRLTFIDGVNDPVRITAEAWVIAPISPEMKTSPDQQPGKI